MPPFDQAPSRHPARLVLALFAFLLCIAGPALSLATPASAALTLDKSAPPRVLFGNESTVTLSATNTSAGPYGFNLSFRDVLPAGVSYVSGSAEFGSAAVEPTVIANAPSAGQTTLIFENVSDISVNATQRLTYRVSHATSGAGALAIGASYVNQATAYANQQPRIVPAFDASGNAQSSPTGMTSNLAQASTQVNAIKIEKSEPNSEGEIMRGLHNHQTVYTLKVTNNGIHPTTGIAVDDYLPAGLEFLRCGTVDNTNSAPTNLGSTEEYAGSGPIDAPGNRPSDLDAAKCVTPVIVETVETDPDGTGPLPYAVYTHVRWTGLGALQSGETIEIQYVAAVPLRENTIDWSTATTETGGSVPATTGAQTANLDNNSGPETRDEQQLTNYAAASGTYRGNDPNPALRLPVSDETTLTRTAEDLAVAKSVDPGEITQNGLSEWTLLFRTSEYRRVTGAIATDTLPNGLCPLGTSNYERTTSPAPGTANAECNPVSGQLPSLNYSSAIENADGSWTLGWNLPNLAPSAEYELTFPTRTRRFYQQNFANDAANPVRAGDSWTNEIDVTGDDHRICANGDVNCTGSPADRIDGDGPDSRTVIDESSASQTSGGITIDKKVLDPTATGVPTPVSCTGAQTANPGAYVDAPTVPNYGIGDRVCWRLRVDFSSTVDTGEPVIRDFFPAGMTYEAGSAQATSRNTISGVSVDASGTADRVLSWSLADVDTSDEVFEWTFSTIVTAAVMPFTADQTITGNLMKLAYRNTGGETYSLRDRVEAEIVKPMVGLVKDVTAVSPAGASTLSGGNATNVPVGSSVSYRVRLSNSGDEAARRTQVWDNLPAGITCTDVATLSISDGGTCAPVPLSTTTYRITWDAADAITVPANGTKNLTYSVTVPQGLPPVANLTNTAGVVEYERDTNLGAGGVAAFIPANNIDAGKTTTNAPRADDPATITLRDVAVAKTIVTTSVDETGNNAASQATIGETITYRVAITVPAGTSLFGTPKLTDVVNKRMPLLSGATVSRSGGAAPTSGQPVLASTGNTLSLTFTGGYVNTAATDAVFTVEFQTRVGNVTMPTDANRRGQTLPNRATFTWQPSSTDPATTTKTADAPNVTIVEPDLRVSKNASLPPHQFNTSTVSAGDTVRYTLFVRNPVDTNVAPSHETVTVDTVPVGITPRKPDGTPATTTGDQVGLSGFPVGTWNATARTITWSHGTVTPGANPNVVYEADVTSPAPAGQVLTNSATVTGSSLSGSAPNERTSTSAYNTGYSATATKALTVKGGALTKTAVSPRATIGDLIDYTVEYTLPPNVTFYDLTFVDTLPDGVEYAGSKAVACLPSCTAILSPDAPELHQEARGANGKQRIAFVVEDVADAPTARTLRLTYQGRITTAFSAVPAPPAPLDAGDVLTNSVSVYYNATDKGGMPDEFPDTSEFDASSGPETADVTVKEPQLTLDKHVSGIPANDDIDRRDTQPGDSYTYTLKVTNTGTSPAYDIDVTDTPSDLLTNVVANAAGVSPSGTATVIDGDGNDGTLAWKIPGPLAVGDTVTLTYTAELVDSSLLSADDTVVNTAKVPSYWGSTTAEHTATPAIYREYTTDPPTDTVTLDVRLPNVTVSKTTGGTDGLGGYLDSANAEVGEAFPWRIVITNPSPSSVAKDVKVVDVLPAGWTFKTGSASFVSTPTRPDVFSSVPTIVTATTGDTLTWADIGDIAPGGQVVLTFNAVPDLSSRPNANPQVNDVTVTAKDSDDQTGSADGPYEDADTANANLQLPTLTVAKTPDGANAIAGTTNNYTVVVRNTSSTATARDVVVTDVLQAHQSYVAGAATAVPTTGFSEIAPVVDEGDEEDPEDDTTTIGWTITSIAPGASVTITVPVKVPADLATDTTLRNGVSVVSREVTTPVTDNGSFLSKVSTDVGVVKTVTAPAANAVPGQNITYSVVATNHGPSVATGVTVKDTLPSTLTLVSAPGCEAAEDDERKLTCNAGTLAVNGTKTFTITAKVAASATGSISNTATVTSTTPDGNPLNNSSTANKSLSPLADLVVTKAVSKATVLQGEQFSYEITVTNDGPSDATSVTLTDTLPAASNVVLVTTGTGTDTGTCTPDTTTNAVSCALGTLTPGQTATITVVAKGVGVGTFNNVAAATTTTTESSTTNNSSNVDVKVNPVANIGIEKTAAATVAANGNLTYSLTLTNDGPSAATNVVVTDVLPAGVEFVSASTECTEDDGTVTCELATLPVTSVADPAPVLTITVKVPWALADTTVENTATIEAPEADEDPTDNSSTVETDVGPAANLKTVKTAPVLPIPQSVSYEYVVTVKNVGPSTAVAAKLDDPMPTGVTALGAVTDKGTCTVVATAVNCTFGNLAKDEIATVTITARGDVPGTPNNVATASSTTPEVDPTDNVDDAAVEILAASDVAIVKTAPATAEANSLLTYTLAITNNGPSDATDVTVTDNLPPNVDFRSADAGCTAVSGTVTCTVGDLATGDTVEREITVFVPYAIGGQSLTNIATVTATEVDLVPENNSSQVTTVVDGVADLVVTKTAGGAVAGGQATWTVTVRNDGPTAAQDVKLVDQLPAGTTIRGAQPSVGTCSGHGRDLVCELGTIAAGGSAQLTIVADVAANTTGQQLRNTATATSPTADPDKTNNTGTADVVVTPAPPTSPDLHVTKVASTTKPELGKALEYRIDVTNRGQVTAKDVRLTDTMSSNVVVNKVRSTQGRCSSAKSTANCELGAIAPGQKVTIVVTVTPTTPGALSNTVSVMAEGQSDEQVQDNRAVANVKVEAKRATATISKKASRKSVQGGKTVTYTVTVKMGKRAGSNLRVCDRLPHGLAFVRATGAQFRKGLACWTIPYLGANQKKTVRIVARTDRSDRARTVTNTAVLTGSNVARRKASAAVRIAPALARPGGVTG